MHDYLASQGAFFPNRGAGFTIGYSGTIHEWCVWDTTRSIVWAFPHCTRRLMGPCAFPRADLPANARLVRRQRYADMPRYRVRFDVCIIPLRAPEGSALLAAVSPTELHQ